MGSDCISSWLLLIFLLCIGKNAHENIASFKADSVEIKCEENETLLGVNIDFMLSFDDHVTDICKKSFKTTGSFKTSWKILHQTGQTDYLQLFHCFKL